MGYALRNGVTFASVGRRLVFLDVPADRYFMLDSAAEAGLREVIATGASSEPALLRLVEAGLLTSYPGPARLMACRLPPPATSLLDQRRPTAAPWQAARAALAVIASLVRLRRHRLAANLAAVSHVVCRNDVRAAPDRLAEIAAAFARAGRWISTQDRCLAQSLAVGRAARAAGLTVDIVFGVSLGPFRAHCWVQSGGAVVNDRVETVSRYTPILVA